jgi:WD40 repeat protein
LALHEDILLMSGDYSGGIYVWNQSTFELLQQMQGHSKAVRSIIVLDNGSLATASFTIKIWAKINETCFEFLKKLTGHTDWINSLAVLPRNMFASASQDKSVRIWDQNSFECIRILTDHKDSVLGLAILKNGYFVSISYDKTAIVWDNCSFSKIAHVTTPARLYSVSSYLGDSFITGDTDGTIQIRSQTLLKYSDTLNAHTNTITGLTFFENGFLASSSFDGTIRLWDKSLRSTVIERHSQSILALNLFRNGSLISINSNGISKTWNTDQYILYDTIYKEN